MKSSPRQLRSPLTALLCGACVALASTPASAQEQRPARSSTQRAPGKESKQKPSRQGDAKEKAKEKRERQQSVAALAEVADGARSLEDLEARAEILSLAADALWPADETAARNIFRRAWEAATAADLADTKRREDELRARRPDVLAPRVAEATRARFAALGILARRDARTAESLLAELKPAAAAFDEGDAEAGDAGRDAANERASALRDDGRVLSPRGAQRLELALDLLHRGDPARAAQLAAPLVAEGPTREFIRFLLGLRPPAPVEADTLYLQLLARTAPDPSADANDILILSSYVVSPHVIFSIDGDASVQLNMVWHQNDEEPRGRAVPTNVRGSFFDLAASVLLRPRQPRATVGEATAEATALYFAAGRLLPFFERDAPQHASAVRARMETLAQAVEAARRESLSAHMRADGERQKNPSDPLEKFIQDVSDPVSRAERYGMRLLAVAEAARRKLWDRARRLAADIPDAEPRREALTIIASYQIKYLTETFADDEDENDFERAVAFAREADVPPAVRARGLAQAAEMAARKGRRERAAELLEEGVVYALRADKGAAQRLDALAVLTTLAARVAPARAWELLTEVVRSANAFDAAAAEAPPALPAAEAMSRLLADNGEPLEKVFEPFRTDELFATMARSDVARTLAEARALEDVETRSAALVAAARAVLERAAAKGPGVAARSTGPRPEKN